MLKSSLVHRKLDAKFKVGGVEATDLLLVLGLGALMNFVFGRFSIGPVFIFGIPAILFAVLYFGKRGKPDDFLKHALKFYLSPGNLHAGEERKN